MIESHVIGYTEDGNKIVEKLERVHTRKIDRKVARNIMKKRGYKHVAKREYSKTAGIDGREIRTRNRNYFSLNWRENASSV